MKGVNQRCAKMMSYRVIVAFLFAIGMTVSAGAVVSVPVHFSQQGRVVADGQWLATSFDAVYIDRNIHYQGTDSQPWLAGQQLAQHQQRSMKEAISIAKQRFPGRVLSAKLSVNRKGKPVYRIKILSPSGSMRVIAVPATR